MNIVANIYGFRVVLVLGVILLLTVNFIKFWEGGRNECNINAAALTVAIAERLRSRAQKPKFYLINCARG